MIRAQLSAFASQRKQLQSAPMNSAQATASAPSAESATTSSARLSFGAKFSYGIGEIIVAIRQSSVLNFLLFFYTNVVMLSPSLAGLALAVGRIWDGVNDPVVGYLSDSTTSRFGRRRPYLLASTLPLGLSFFLLWSPPQGMGSMGNFLFLAAAYILMDAFFTLYATPYLALGAELSHDYHERTQIVTTRAVFHGLGALLTVLCLSKVAGGSPATIEAGVAALPTTLPPEVVRAGFVPPVLRNLDTLRPPRRQEPGLSGLHLVERRRAVSVPVAAGGHAATVVLSVHFLRRARGWRLCAPGLDRRGRDRLRRTAHRPATRRGVLWLVDVDDEVSGSSGDCAGGRDARPDRLCAESGAERLHVVGPEDALRAGPGLLSLPLVPGFPALPAKAGKSRRDSTTVAGAATGKVMSNEL